MIQKITLTAELENGRPDYRDMRTDVIVQMDSGDKYVATFLTYRHLETLIETEKQTGKIDKPGFYRLLEMVLVKDFNGGDIQPVIERMMLEGDFQLIFKKI